MKKLIISIVATASLALVAKADGALLNATSFENYDGDFSVNNPDSDGAVGQYYWLGGDDGSEFLIKALAGEGGLGTKSVDRPKYWANQTGDDLKALAIDTDKALSRHVNADKSARDIGTDGLYFDSMVQFTATEEAPSVTDGDKLIVWLKQTAEATEATDETEATAAEYALYVTAGVWSESRAERVDYQITNISIAPDSWHRLSIAVKMAEGDIPTFKVYVDGAEAKAGDVADFQSLVFDDNGTLWKQITSVSFQGKGAIDDLVWTTEDPYAPVRKTLSVVVNDVDQDFATWTYSIDGGDVKYLVNGSNEIEVLQAATKIVFTCEIENGYSLEKSGFTGVSGDSTTIWTREITVAELSFEDALTFAPEKVEEPVVGPFTVTVDDETTTYATLAEAIANANGATIKLTENATLTEKLTVAEAAVIDLNGQTLTLAPNSGYTVVVNNSLTIRDSIGGGKVVVPGYYGFGVGSWQNNVDKRGSLTIESGAIVGDSAEYLIGVFIGTVTISGGTFNASYCALNVIGKIDPVTGDVLDATCATATVTGGTFTVKETDPTVPWDIGAILGQDGCVAVSAGTFNVQLMDSLCAEGYVPTTEAVDGYYTVVEKADEKPTAGETELEADDFTDPDTVNSTTEVTLPEGWTVSGDKILNKGAETFATFPSYYTATVVDGVIKFALNDTVKPVIAESKEGETTVKPMEFAKEGEADVVKLNVSNRNNNLFYGVKAAATLDALNGATPAWATTRGANPPALTKSGNAQFFKVVVTDVK